MKKKTREPFKAPEPEEVRAYWREARLSGDPDKFRDHHESLGWMRGRTAVKDWKAAARNWSRDEFSGGKAGHRSSSKPGPYSHLGKEPSPYADLHYEVVRYNDAGELVVVEKRGGPAVPSADAPAPVVAGGDQEPGR